MDKDLLLIAKLKRAKNRFKVFLALDKPAMPAEIVRKVYGKYSSSYFTVVSRALAELKGMVLIEVINPKEKTGRTYRLTKLGKKIKAKLGKDY